MSGTGAKMQIGISTDNTSAIMEPTLVSTLNGVTSPAFSFSKSTVANRNIILTASEANITGGDIMLRVEMAIGA
jgi:hypothetical protein